MICGLSRFHRPQSSQFPIVAADKCSGTQMFGHPRGLTGRRLRSQRGYSEMTSPPERVVIIASVRSAVPSDRNRTEPSAKAIFAPLVWNE
ncbi:unnamed protein product [Tuwongella immobilis]|uniref:Uncharacterized protein n=1 Tax=Tuwongella immobilis TaxID=692036 RepID=A0A6C2YJG0_9BACT|nr:unnamed protein product [Tuwongella immobilis]VTR98613.1 unnamed protein product [Tuwongella immobilis]